MSVICAQMFFSIAGKQAMPSITDALKKLNESKAVPKRIKDNLKYTLACAEKGAYPSPAYYQREYELRGTLPYESEVEILTSIDRILQFYEKSYFAEHLIEASNIADTPEEMLETAQKVVAQMTEDIGINKPFPRFKPFTVETLTTAPEGLKIDLPSIDEVTGGFKRGQVATVAAFSGGGKSTFWLNTTYNCIMDGKKVVYISLEMSPEILWEMLFAKYLIEEGGQSELNVQDVSRRRLSEEQVGDALNLQVEFDKKFRGNLLIIDESYITKALLNSSDGVKRLYAACDKDLHGLDLIIWDHVHQLELMNPKQGDIVLRNIASATKTYTGSSGQSPVCGWACQVNREAYKALKKAKRGEQKTYDLTAIGDLNEVIRSSSYIIFLHKEDASPELKITMPKHRYGESIINPVALGFEPAQLRITDTVIEKKERAAGKEVSADTLLGLNNALVLAWNRAQEKKPSGSSNRQTLEPFANKRSKEGPPDLEEGAPETQYTNYSTNTKGVPEQRTSHNKASSYCRVTRKKGRKSYKQTQVEEVPGTTTQDIAVRLINQYGPLRRKDFAKLFKERSTSKTPISRLFCNWKDVKCVKGLVSLRV